MRGRDGPRLHRAAYENVTGYWQQADLPEPQRIYFSVGVQPQCDFLPKECLEKGWVKVTPTPGLEVLTFGAAQELTSGVWATGHLRSWQGLRRRELCGTGGSSSRS